MCRFYHLSGLHLLLLLLIMCASSMAQSPNSKKSDQRVPSDSSATKSEGLSTPGDKDADLDKVAASVSVVAGPQPEPDLAAGWHALEARLSAFDAAGSRREIGKLRALIATAAQEVQIAAAPRLEALELAVATVEAWRKSMVAENDRVPVQVLAVVASSIRGPDARKSVVKQLLDRARGDYAAGETEAAVVALLQFAETRDAMAEVVQRWFAEATPKQELPPVVVAEPAPTLSDVLVVNLLVLIVCAASYQLWRLLSKRNEHGFRPQEAATTGAEALTRQTLPEAMGSLDFDYWRQKLPRLKRAIDEWIKMELSSQASLTTNNEVSLDPSQLAILKGDIEKSVVNALKGSQHDELEKIFNRWVRDRVDALQQSASAVERSKEKYISAVCFAEVLRVITERSNDFDERLLRLESDEMKEKLSAQRVSIGSKLVTAKAALPPDWRASLVKWRETIARLGELAELRKRLLAGVEFDDAARAAPRPEHGAVANALRKMNALAEAIEAGESLLQNLSVDSGIPALEKVSRDAAKWIKDFASLDMSIDEQLCTVETLLPNLHAEIVAGWEPLLRRVCNLGSRALFDKIRLFLEPLDIAPVDSLRGAGYNEAFHDIASFESGDSEMREGQIIRTNRAAFTIAGGGLFNNGAAIVVVCRPGVI